MIVKNESHVIGETLKKLVEKVPIDYYVISDTGSTDNTKEIIKEFFDSKGIGGEIFNDPWKDFGYNRTVALEHAYKKSSYLLIHDADDEFGGNIQIPPVTKKHPVTGQPLLEYDAYLFQFGDQNGISYYRIQLVNNHMKWKYTGVLHEAIGCLETSHTQTVLKGNYWTVSGKSGARSQDPQKYYKDAQILAKAYEDCKASNDSIYHRYGFYCANSYKDAGKPAEAIEWYTKVLSNQNWVQEKYVSCINLFYAYRTLGQQEKGMFYLVQSALYDKERLECICELVAYYCSNSLPEVAYAYYSLVKDFYENKFLSESMDDKLFMDISKSNFILPYYMIIVAERVKNYSTGIQMYKIIFAKKHLERNEQLVGNVLFNLQFFIDKIDFEKDQDFIPLFQGYLSFLKSYGFSFHKFDFLLKYESFGVKIPMEKPVPKFSPEECKESKKILFYTGYSYTAWNYTFSLSNALGGSETAVCYLANQFPKDYQIYITGGVAEEVYDNIHFVNLENMKKLVQENAFHTIIISRYIAFYEMFPYFSAYQTLIWGHDIILFPYGCNLSVNDILKKWNQKINGCICQTEWHKQLFLSLYPELDNKIQVINNGIKTELFCFDLSKKTNRFLYSSCTERGLSRLLHLWPGIVERLPDAELLICSYNDFPRNEDETRMKEIIESHVNIQHLGKMSPHKLYELMSTVDYWLYPSYFQETSCITSLEMLASKVICLYYPVAGLVNTLGDYGIPIKESNEIEVLMSLTQKQKESLRESGYQYAMSCSWKSRAQQWFKVIAPELGITIKIVNMKRRPDRKEQLEKQLVNVGIHSYEFIEAVDGNELTPFEELRLLFERNDSGYKRGVLGCALSHIKLWKELSLDVNNDFYVILEDDIVLCENFKEKLEYLVKQFTAQNLEHLGLGEYNSAKILNQDLKALEIIEKDPYKIWNITFAYIISKPAATKLIDFINHCSVKSAIDNVQSYGYVLQYHTLNELIVHGQFVNNTFGSDIISSPHVHFEPALSETKTIKVSFCDWWQTEYCGGAFDGNNNFFTNLLKNYGPVKNIQFVPHYQQPDILFYSIFENQHLDYPNARKIFYCGEPYSQRVEADYNLTFDWNNVNNTRLPLWLCYMNEFLMEECNRRKNGIVLVPKNRTGFCSFIASGPGLEGNREEFVRKLSAYKKVDCGGNYLNNLGAAIPLGINGSGKINHNQNYKFAMAFESKNYPGYVTEKICDVYKSQCIPIYWGTRDVVKDFNPTTFINANDFKDFDELVEHVIKVDQDDTLYASYFKEPFFSNMWLDVFKDPNKTFYKNVADRILGRHTNLVDSTLKKLEKLPTVLDLISKGESWTVLVDPLFSKRILEDYINIYDNIQLTETVSTIDINCDKVLAVDLNSMNRSLNHVKDVSKIHHLNVEPLNFKQNVENIRKIVEKFPDSNIYDYSLTNLRILEKNGFNKESLIFMPYFDSPKETNYLKNLSTSHVKSYDFGMIHYTPTLYCPRRMCVRDTLVKLGFSVHIVVGFGETRDQELAKCKVILNIHSTPTQEPNRIFEHLRCNRLLYAGYKILSEDNCEDMDPNFLVAHQMNLKFLNFSEFSNRSKILQLFPELDSSIQLHVYSVWHHKIFDHCYEKLDSQSLSKITMFDVNSSYQKHYNKNKNYNIICEYELAEYNKVLQATNYCQTSCFYHVYKNQLYKNYSHIGFIQYDMELEKDFITDIESNLVGCRNTIFYNLAIGQGGKVEYEKLCEPYTNSVLEQYNKYFNTHFTIHGILSNPLSKDFVCLHTFVISTPMYEKMMKWFCSILDWLHKNYINGYYFSPMSDFSEAIFGLFLLLERIQEPTIQFKPLKLKHDWPKLHNQTEFTNYKQGNLYFSLQQLINDEAMDITRLETFEKYFKSRQLSTKTLLDSSGKELQSLWKNYFVNAEIYTQEIPGLLFDIIIVKEHQDKYTFLLKPNGLLVVHDNGENLQCIKNTTPLQFTYGVEGNCANNVSEIVNEKCKISKHWIYIPKEKNAMFGDPVMFQQKEFCIILDEKVVGKIKEYEYGFFNTETNQFIINQIPTREYEENDVWLFYAFENHNYNVLEDYIKGLQSKYNIKYTKDKILALASYPKKISFVMYIQDVDIVQHYLSYENIEISFLNTEPLTIPHNLEIVKKYRQQFPKLFIYDYSLENIKVMKEAGMVDNVFHLCYEFTTVETKHLKQLYQDIPKEFDYGFVVHGNLKTNTIDTIITKRRKNVVEYLMNKGFSVHIISGWGEDRDRELARCKTILNIHSEKDGVFSKNFEHIRCDRLLEAGFQILSESCYDLTHNYPNLSIIHYDDFFKISKKYTIEYGTDDYKIDITGTVYKKCWTKIMIPQDKNSLFGDPCYLIEKFIFVGDRGYKENEVIELDYIDNLLVYYGIHTHKIDVTSIVLEKCVMKLVIPENKNELFGDPVSGQLKKIWLTTSKDTHVYSESEIIEVSMNNNISPNELNKNVFFLDTLTIVCESIEDKKLINDWLKNNDDWVIYKHNINNIVLKEIKNYNKYLNPISFSGPLEKMIKEIPPKTKILALVQPTFGKHIYNTEQEYYQDYQSSLFGLTHCKNGWESLRHYEILLNGCIPYFCDLHMCPKQMLSLYPKEQISETNQMFERIQNWTIDQFYNEPNLVKKYHEHLDYLLDYTRQHLTTIQMARYVLKKIDRPNVTKVLFLSKKTQIDYLRCLLLHGFKSLLGSNCHDYPKIPHLYSDCENKDLYGKGFTYSKLLEKDLHDTTKDTTLEKDIENHVYDLIIYGDYTKGTIFLEKVLNNYKSSEIVFMNGEDHVTHLHLQDFYDKILKGHYCFIREFRDFQTCEYMVPYIEYFQGVWHPPTLHNLLNMKIPNILKDRNYYIPIYQKLLENKRESCQHLLEIGSGNNSSMVLFHEYFQNATIHGFTDKDNFSNYSRIQNYDYIKRFNLEYVEKSFQRKKMDIIIIHNQDLTTYYFCLENYPKLLNEKGIMVVESTLNDDAINFLPDNYMYKNYDNYCIIEPMKKKTTAVVFICHDTSSLNKIKKHLSDEDTYVIYVGNRECSSQLKEESSKIFIANSFTDNIENEYLLLTFTAWYLISKNNLFVEYDYLCLFEYDVELLVDDFFKTIQKECQNSGHSIFGFCPLKNYFKFDINWSVLENFLKQKQVDYQYESNSLWYTTTNYCLKRNIILEFVDWYFPACLQIKNQDLSNFSYYHERLFWIFISTKNYCVGNQSHLLEHTQSKSHGFNRNLPVNDFDWQLYVLLNPDLATAGLQTQEQLTKHFIEYGYLEKRKYKKLYYLVYDDESKKFDEERNKLLETVETFSDAETIIFPKSKICPEFINQHSEIFKHEKGGGYWLWKPFIILKTLQTIEENSYLFYSDTKYHFVEPFEDLVQFDQDAGIVIWKNKPNEYSYFMKVYCKDNVLQNYPEMKEKFMCWAGAMILKNTSKTRMIIKEWLEMCCNVEYITDSPCLSNGPDFVDHRHDQALLSIVLHNHNIVLQEFPKRYLQNNNFPW